MTTVVSYISFHNVLPQPVPSKYRIYQANTWKVNMTKIDEVRLPKISGFLITEPICLRAWAPAFCTFIWESVSTSHKRGTILGRQEESCFGAQKAIAPRSSTLPGKKTNYKTLFRKTVKRNQATNETQYWEDKTKAALARRKSSLKQTK